MDLVHPYRLIFTKEDSHTVSVRIEEIEDYRYCQTKLKHFSLCFMYRGVLISLIVHEAWAIRFSVAKLLPHLHGSSCVGFDRSDVSIQLDDQFPDFNIVLHIQEKPI